MRRDTEFCGTVHFPRANLHLERNAVRAEHGGVQRLVHIGLRGGDVILKPSGHRTEHIVNQT